MHPVPDGDDDALSRRAFALLGVLAEPRRLRVFAAVVLGAVSESEIRARTGLSPDDVGRGLARLVAAGVVETSPEGLRVREDVLAAVVAEAHRAETKRWPTAAELGATREQAAVLGRFLRKGRLESIPARAEKRARVLDFLAGHFRPGSTYSEAEVNSVLARFHPDTASLRRYMVDEGFLERREGRYWRAGGTFDVE